MYALSNSTDLRTDLYGAIEGLELFSNTSLQRSVKARIIECEFVIPRLLCVSHFVLVQQQSHGRRYVVGLEQFGYISALRMKGYRGVGKLSHVTER